MQELPRSGVCVCMLWLLRRRRRRGLSFLSCAHQPTHPHCPPSRPCPPPAGSLVDFFNRDLVQACRDTYTRQLERQALPVEEGALAGAHAAAKAAAMARFERERFGSQVAALRQALEAAIEREYRWVGG